MADFVPNHNLNLIRLRACLSRPDGRQATHKAGTELAQK